MTTGGHKKGLITFATNRLLNVISVAGRELELRRLRRALAEEQYQVKILKESVKCQLTMILSLAHRRVLLEQALADAHGTIFDLQPDPIAADVATELKQMAQQGGSL